MKATAGIYPQLYITAENTAGTETVFFEFEADFVEDNVRCIPSSGRV